MKIIKGLFDFLRLTMHRYYSTKRIKRYQLKQLKRIYDHAVRNSSFYRMLYKDHPFETLDDFYRLPVINKQIMMEHFTDLNTVGLVKEDVVAYAVRRELEKDHLDYYQDKYVVGLSSGTSGNKGIYVTDRELTERLPFVFLARSGIPLRLLPFRMLFMLRVFSQGFNDINATFISLSYLSTMEELDRVIERINTLNINILMAPPSMINRLLPRVGEITPDIKLVMTYAEVLSSEEKARFRNAFSAEVIEIYQASEGQMASACKCGHLHINEDLVFVELYDEHDRLIEEPGVVGHKMIVTNLVNEVQPLIRYEMNDMVVLDETCACGSRFRRIRKVLGRHDDILYFYKGGEVQPVFPDVFVRWIIVTSDNIREFKVLQDKVNEITVIVDLIDKHIDIKKVLKEKLVCELNELGINGVKISIKYQDIHLPNEKNKYKRFESNMSHRLDKTKS